MPDGSPFPPGFDHGKIASYALWLLAKRNQRAAKRRTFSVPADNAVGIAAQFIRLLLPWRIYEYPGRANGLADLCGVKPNTAKKWIHCPALLPRRHALTMARVAREHASKATAIAEELEAWAAGREQQIAEGGLEKVRRRGG